MKTLTCDLCEHEASGETFDDWMNALKPHYMQAHADVMAKHMTDPESGKKAMMAWMEENQKRFEAA